VETTLGSNTSGVVPGEACPKYGPLSKDSAPLLSLDAWPPPGDGRQESEQNKKSAAQIAADASVREFKMCSLIISHPLKSRWVESFCTIHTIPQGDGL
jgi:hypothetical protein